ncbi:MAG: PDZ domain-containing protein, partial [Nitrospinaceae bacterium]|nr:PDZ domain-containing protein [Nitrospinaceae bacterium]NIR55992.1 PDZ domain-containing protein [Nitrospinaceae bacterium]NIS86435.1 PDZ domain-containing protein [Nitrospinaceae bacterium]NIT83273.1 PDZ domain-containing protein [Nitrospinaceae bacterium]NIU45480.1 PDZ domain-containing protein [Nitrospinaceae bacterium]
MKILHLALLTILLAPALPAAAQEYAVPYSGSPYKDIAELEENQILHLPTGIVVSFEQMIDTLSGSRVIYIGETHDNLEAHRVQLEVIRRLYRKFPGKISVGMEMFRRSARGDLERWHRGELSDKQFRKLFHKNWGPGYGLYQPIFEFLKEQGIPLVGLKSSRAMEQQFREKGPGEEGMPEIDEQDVYHREYSMALFGGNDTHTDVVSKPYLMLLLWEEAMADTVAGFLKDEANADRKLIVLAGGFHVQYGYGIPKRAFRRHPHNYSILLPVVTEVPKELKHREMKMKKVSIPLISADFGLKVAYKVPPSNKIRLGVFLEEADNGLKVLKVEKNSNASRMQIQAEDVLMTLDGQPVMDVEDLAAKLQKHDFGDSVRLTVQRGQETLEIEGTLQDPG